MVVVKDNGFEEKIALNGQLWDRSNCHSLPV